jgi:thiopeptide-type bacteriocin biosynthesis protein
VPWHSIHFQPVETHDIFLVRAYRPFLEQHVWPTAGTRAFFVRYADEAGPHLRLRFRAEAEWLTEVLHPNFETHFAERGTWREVPYTPETERYGGEAVLPWAEEYFHVSTRVVLDRLRRDRYTYGDALFDALQMHVTTFFAAWMERPEAAAYCTQLCEGAINAYFEPTEGLTADELLAAVRTDFEAAAARQIESLRVSLQDTWEALRQQHHDAAQPEWLRWIRGNQLILKELRPQLTQVLPSLLHLTNNRLGIQNHDEAYLWYLLSRALAG